MKGLLRFSVGFILVIFAEEYMENNGLSLFVGTTIIMGFIFMVSATVSRFKV